MIVFYQKVVSVATLAVTLSLTPAFASSSLCLDDIGDKLNKYSGSFSDTLRGSSYLKLSTKVDIGCRGIHKGTRNLNAINQCFRATRGALEKFDAGSQYFLGGDTWERLYFTKEAYKKTGTCPAKLKNTF